MLLGPYGIWDLISTWALQELLWQETQVKQGCGRGGDRMTEQEVTYVTATELGLGGWLQTGAGPLYRY